MFVCLFPSLLFHVPLVIVAAHICAQTLDILGDVRLDFSVANVCEAVAVPVSDIVVLEAGSLDGLEEVNSLWDI